MHLLKIQTNEYNNNFLIDTFIEKNGNKYK